MKKVICLVISTFVIFATSCGNPDETISSNQSSTLKKQLSTSQSSETQETTDEIISDESSQLDDSINHHDDFTESFVENMYELSEKKFDYDIAVYDSKTFMLLQQNGTVIAKGHNDTAQLANGSRDDSSTISYEWQLVEGLSDIIQIVPYYALDKNGNLFQWGEYTLSPQKLDFDEPITRIISAYHNNPCYNTNFAYEAFAVGTNSVYSIYQNRIKKINLPTELNTDIYDITHFYTPLESSYAILSNGKIYLIDRTNGEILYESERDDYQSFNTVQNSSYGIGDILAYDSNGEVFRIYTINSNGKEVIEESLGGQGNIKCLKSHYNEFYFNLFESGALTGKGRNSYGELGDGTELEYYGDEPLIVPITYPIRDYMIINDDAITVFAVDENNTIYAWGSGYDSSPTEIINNSEFYIFD